MTLMKPRNLSITAGLLAALMMLPAWAQQPAGALPGDSYREPLALANSPTTAVAQPLARRPSLPVFSVQPTAGERISRDALTFVSRAAVQVASEQSGVSTPVPSPTYQPYRPGVSVPEPATQERSCPPLATPNLPADCSLR
ncbi:hypothetical protein [Dyella telluris]|uniref:Uncharacterized protein n=1 Tax=Dyella telluris TaxID=2763498 RepID=A0A7G8PZ42_9GAMM|nr:hypothetical protein [Dyella telluris]QNJ99799.1 hypothetical protein H8F01_11645 [Dyella telluris]